MTTGWNTFPGEDENQIALTGVYCIADVLPFTSADKELNLGEEPLKFWNAGHRKLHKPWVESWLTLLTNRSRADAMFLAMKWWGQYMPSQHTIKLTILYC